MEELLYELRDGVAYVTFNRPQARNALTFAMYERLAEICNGANEDRSIRAILMTGGTGVGSRDQTFETVSELLDKSLPGYGELFRMLSFEQVGPAAMLSRAIGGLMAGKVLLTMPGSPAAVQLAMDRLIIPELGHLVREARK